MPVEKIII